LTVLPAEFPLADLAVLMTVLAGVGVLGGLIAGLLGVGGGIVIVPALFHVLGLLGVHEEVRMHVAVGTSLATIVPTSIASMRTHLGRGAVDVALLKDWGVWIALGVLAGTAMAVQARGEVLTAIFAAVALLVAGHMAFIPEGVRLCGRLPTGAAKAGIAALIGAVSAMMGIGGGTLTVPTLSLCGYPIHRAVGTASAVGLIIAVPAAIGFMASGWQAEGLPPASLGHVSLPGLLAIIPFSLITAPWGARLAHGMDKHRLRRVFALFLVLTSARMIYSVFT